MQVQCFNGGLKGREQANGKTNAARGLENVDPAADAGNGLGKVRRASLQKLLPLLAEDFAREARQSLRCNGLAGGAQGAADPQCGRETGFEVQVARALLPCGGN